MPVKNEQQPVPSIEWPVEMKALQDVCGALLTLDEDARYRVLKYAASRFKVYMGSND